MRFASRTLANSAVTLVLAVAVVSLDRLYDLSLRDSSFLTGWLLVVGIGLLAVYNGRKKLPFLPLFSSAAWLQFHIYLGCLVIVFFLLHTSFRAPSGPMEVVLWLLFIAVAGSGLLGLALSRIVPKWLGRDGERIIFERIPVFRARLAREAEALAMRSVTKTSSNTIAQYYGRTLQPFFHGPGNLLAHLTGFDRTLQRMSREIASQRRYLNRDGREILDEIEWRVVAKNDLDREYALQWLLKGWLFVHIPLTYSLILVAVVHVVLVHAFGGGMP